MLDWLFGPVLSLLWSIFVQLLLTLLDVFTQVMDFLGAGIIRDLIFTNGEFNLSQLPMPFLVFGILGLILMIVFFITNYITSMINSDAPIKEKMYLSLKNAFKSMLYVLMIPVLLFIGFGMIDMINGAISQAFNIGEFSFGKLVWLIGDYNNTDWANIDFTKVPSDFTAPAGLTGSGFLAAILGIIVSLYLTVTLGFSMAQKLFDIYLLFIISPVYAATTVADGGERFKGWCTSVFGRLLTIISIKLLFAIFVIVMMPILKIAGENKNPIVTISIILFGMGGGAIFCEGGMKLVSQIINDKAGQEAAEGSNQASRMAGRMILGGAMALGGMALGSASNIVTQKGRARKNEKRISRVADKNFNQSIRNAKMGGGILEAGSFVGGRKLKADVGMSSRGFRKWNNFHTKFMKKNSKVNKHFSKGKINKDQAISKMNNINNKVEKRDKKFSHKKSKKNNKEK